MNGTTAETPDGGNLADYHNPITVESSSDKLVVGDQISFPERFTLHTRMASTFGEAQLAICKYNSEKKRVFYRNGRLVVVTQDENEQLTVVNLNQGLLRLILSSAGHWGRIITTKDGRVEFREDDIPRALLESVLAAPWETLNTIPRLQGLISGVLLTSSGQLVHTEGYHPQTARYLIKSYDLPPVPEAPTMEDINKAKEILWSIFGEFVFADGQTEESVDYQNTLVALLTAIYRPTWEGPTPIWVVNKTSQRTGGSLLQSIVCILAYGSTPTPHASTKRKDEIDKIIRTIISEQQLYGMIDNIEAGTNWTPEILLSATSGSGATATRNMGTYDIISRKSETFFVVNGINIDIRADVTGRVFVTRLIPQKAWQDLHWSRTKAQIEALALELHPAVVWSAAIIRQYWTNLGEPAPPACPGNISEYADWYRFICGQLYAAGFQNVLKNQDEIQTAENETENEGIALLTCLELKFDNMPFTPGELTTILMDEARARKNGGGTETDVLNHAPDEIVSRAVRGELTPVNTGLWLRSMVGKKFRGCEYYLQKGTRTRTGSWKYSLVPVESQKTLIT